MRGLFFAFLVLAAASVSAQGIYKPDPRLARQLTESHNLRRTFKADPAYGALTRWYDKEVLDSRVLPLADDFGSVRHTGPGEVALDREVTISGRGSIRLDTPASLEKKNPTNRNYGMPEIIRSLDGEDLGEWNRFSVWVKVSAPGIYIAFAGFMLYNEGEKITPTPGRFEGQHFETVYPGEWQRIVWEIPDLYRDRATGLGVNIMMTGAPAGASEQMSLWVDDMRLERVVADKTRGFDLTDGTIAYSHSGYKTGARKQALVQNVRDRAFQLRDSAGAVVYRGRVRVLENGFGLLDFSDFDRRGEYTIAVGDTQSKPFAIGDDAWLATAWRTLNFFYAERCGYDQPGIHQECHGDVLCIHPDGRTLSVAGGWHDAADMTQGIGNTVDGGVAMLEMAAAVKGKDPELYERLLEEARWGLNWVMRTRFGDGYRQGGLIIGIHTKNIHGDKDDMEARATNAPSSNLAGAYYCALAAPFYEESDPVFARWCRVCAVEDFDFAMQGLDVDGNLERAAQAMTVAMQLFRLTREPRYIDLAAGFARTVMECQQIERQSDWMMPLRGFFYETTARKRILAYYHQSNEHRPIEGLAMLLTDAPDHADAPLWSRSCEAYADYLRDIAGVVAPYGVLPSAIYELDNTDYSNLYHEGDQVGLPSLEEYNAQVRNGIPLSEVAFLRRFPVAYQFRGFHAVIMGKAKAAFILARLLGDSELRHIATRQMEYIVGMNPFAASTIYGDGYDYHPLYGAYAGDVVGAVPVGIETFENDDEPYWPTQNNCTYKEIWTHTTARMMWLVAELFRE